MYTAQAARASMGSSGQSQAPSLKAMTAPPSLGGRARGNCGSTRVAAAASAAMATSSGTTPVRATPLQSAALRAAMSRMPDAATRVPSQDGHCHSRCSSVSGAALQCGQTPPPAFHRLATSSTTVAPLSTVRSAPA
eukprot:2894907-Lingulodinium_polyedra.AAC.1